MSDHIMKDSSFHHLLLKTLAMNWNNNFQDNYDLLRFGNPERNIVDGRTNLLEIEKYLDELESFYFLLENNRSKEILLQLLAFRILGHRKIRLPLSQPEYWDTINELVPFMNRQNKLDVTFLKSTRELCYTDLTLLGLPIKLYTMLTPVLIQFLIKQYEYVTDDRTVIGARQGDVVIDCGACWGDTALFFANQIKEEGKVYSFEFIPANLKVAYKNFSFNPLLGERIKVIEKPLWDESGVKMYYTDTGPASKVSTEPVTGCEEEVDTISIDDFVQQEQLNQVNFIKMDIEGAEQYALKGAQKTLRQFKPQLAISIYHNMNDFSHMAHLINDLNLGYKFYLDHFTIHHEETVLYAKA
jgi:FkbM family methyltransferase